MLYLKNQKNLIECENLKLRLENYKLKEKIRNLENGFSIMTTVQRKFFNKKLCKIFFIKIILVTKEWNKVYKEFFYDNFNVLLKINEKFFLNDIMLIKQRIYRSIALFVNYINLVKFIGKIISKIFFIFNNFQKKFNYFTIFFNQILTHKLHLFYNIRNNQKISIINKDFLNYQFDTSYFIKSKFKFMANILITNPEIFVNLIMIKKIKKKKEKKIIKNSYKLIIKLDKIGNELSLWINSFLFKNTTENYNQLQIYKKLKNLIFSIKYIMGNCFYHIQKTEIKIILISKKINQFSKKIEILKKKIHKLFIIKRHFKKKKTKKIDRKIIENKLIFFLLLKYKFEYSFFKIKKFFKILNQKSSFKEFVYFLQIKKEITFKDVLNKSTFFNRITEFSQLEKHNKISFKKGYEINKLLSNNYSPNSINICMYRVSDIDKELYILWTILKLFNFCKYQRFFVVNSLIRRKYFKLKNQFNQIVLILKQKIFGFQKSNFNTKKLLLENNIKKIEIENKLHEIKGMEIDFSDILNQIKK